MPFFIAVTYEVNTDTQKNTHMCWVNKGICSRPHPPCTVFILIQQLYLDMSSGQGDMPRGPTRSLVCVCLMPSAPWEDFSVILVSTSFSPLIPPFHIFYLPRTTLDFKVPLTKFTKTVFSQKPCYTIHYVSLLITIQPCVATSFPRRVYYVGVRYI